MSSKAGWKIVETIWASLEQREMALRTGNSRPGHTERDLRCEFALCCFELVCNDHTTANSRCYCGSQKIAT